jgi:hypothetical protein
LALASIWGTFQFGPIGKPSRAAQECADLKSFVISEEKVGKSDWEDYRELVTRYDTTAPSITDRAILVEDIATTVVRVLGHDLAIYKEMEKFSGCVKKEDRSNLPTMIAETESAINYLNGTEAIDGAFFNPELGNWNSNFYSEFVSALDYLKGSSGNTADV